MKIKSLLLGSAAGLFAVSGAQAADAIIAAAPEPVEYVRVCDAFGTGYFYIPGTETCLRVHGYVRYDMNGGSLLGLDTDGDGEGDSWDKNARFSFRTSTASDTELGTLRTYTEVRFNYANSAGSSLDFTDGDGIPLAAPEVQYGVTTGTATSLNFAWIELGGLRIGKDESVFTTWTGYAGSVINDGLVSFGPFDANLISYTFDAGNGFSAIISLEDDSGGSDDGDGNYIPDIAGGAAYEAGAFRLAVVGGYDESAEAGAAKARLDADFGGFGAFIMGGWNSDDVSNRFATWGGDWAVWGGVSAPLTDRITANAQLSYDDNETFGAVGNLVFNVVEGFDITTEVAYQDVDGRTADVFDDATNAILPDQDIDDGQWGGTIRFQRSF